MQIGEFLKQFFLCGILGSLYSSAGFLAHFNIVTYLRRAQQPWQRFASLREIRYYFAAKSTKLTRHVWYHLRCFVCPWQDYCQIMLVRGHIRCEAQFGTFGPTQLAQSLETITYLESPNIICLFTVQILWKVVEFLLHIPKPSWLTNKRLWKHNLFGRGNKLCGRLLQYAPPPASWPLTF